MKRADAPMAPANPLTDNPFDGPGNAPQNPNPFLQRPGRPALPVAPARPAQPVAPPTPPSVLPSTAPPGGTPPPPPIHGQDGVIVPPPDGQGGPGGADPGQNALRALEMFARPPEAPATSPEALLPTPPFSDDPFVPQHPQHTRPTPPPPTGMPAPALAGEPPQTSMGVGSGAGPTTQQAPANKPPAGLAPYAQQAAERISQLPPEAQQQVMQGAAESISNIMEQRGPAAVQQLEAIMRGGQTPPAMQQAGVQRLQSQGFDLQSAWQTFQGMDPVSQFLLVSGLGLGAIGLISALAGQGGVGSFVASALGLGVAGGAAAHGGILGQGAQQTMQGLLGTGQPTPPGGAAPGGAAPGGAAPGGAAPGGASPTAQGRARMLSQTATTRPETLPSLFGQFAGELSPADRSSLDQAASLRQRIRQGGLGGQAAQLAYNAAGVDAKLARLGIEPAAIPVLLDAWGQWSPRNQPRP